MRVCKEWKVRVHPSLISALNLIAAIIQALGQAALMDRTFIKTQAQLMALKGRLYLSRYVDCDRVPAGNLVRILSVSVPTPADSGSLGDVEIRETLVALVNLMPCLQKYDVPETLISHLELLHQQKRLGKSAHRKDNRDNQACAVASSHSKVLRLS
jgi:hypothetical protein